MITSQFFRCVGQPQQQMLCSHLFHLLPAASSIELGASTSARTFSNDGISTFSRVIMRLHGNNFLIVYKRGTLGLAGHHFEPAFYQSTSVNYWRQIRKYSIHCSKTSWQRIIWIFAPKLGIFKGFEHRESTLWTVVDFYFLISLIFPISQNSYFQKKISHFSKTQTSPMITTMDTL